MAAQQEQRVTPYDEKANHSPDSDSDREYGAHHINEIQLLRKLDRHLLPGLCVLYLLSFLDRSNVANARLDGLTADLHMTGNQYLTGLTIFFIGYILFEVPWNIILKRIGPKLWLPAVTFAWGLVATLQGIVVYHGGASGVAGFFVVRFFLGFAEGALFPGVVFYLSMWYKRSERQYRIALFFSCASLAGAFGGILAYAIGLMTNVGGLLFLEMNFYPRGHPGESNGVHFTPDCPNTDGSLTCVVALVAYWFIADWPSKAHFVTEDERAYINARLKADSDSAKDEAFTWGHVVNALADPKVWLYGFAFHTLSLPLYTLSLFFPSIIAALGYSAANAQLLTIPPYALATILTVVYAVVSERYQRRAPFIIVSALTGIIGYCVLLSNLHPTKRLGISYLGTFFAAAGIYPAVALVLSWPAMNVSGQTKRATANAMQITIGNCGAVIGTQLYRSTDGPRYIVGHSVALAYLCGNILVVSTIWLVLSRINKARDAAKARNEEQEWDGEWRGDNDARWKFTL